MKIRKNKNFQRGISLAEVVIGAAILSASLLAISLAWSSYVKALSGNENSIQAGHLLEEGMEAIILFRDFGWAGNVQALSVDTNYYLSWNGTRWVSSSVPAYIDGKYLRHFVFRNVYRDGGANISSSGVLDPNTKKVEVFVSFRAGTATTTKSLSSYIHNLFAN